jgi:ribonuclease HI
MPLPRIKPTSRGEATRKQEPAASAGPASLTLYFDGACEPVNPGGTAAYAWHLNDADGKQIASDHGVVCSGEGATNNLAEWNGVLRGVRHVKSLDWNGILLIRGDSQLIIYQLTGKYQCKNEALRVCLDECLELLTGLDWRAEWIRREENEEADRLSKLACE